MTAVLERPPSLGAPPGVLVAAGIPAGWDWSGWATAHPDRLLVAGAGFDPAWERAALVAARSTGRALLSLRFTPTELLIGPLWTDGTTTGCAGCAHAAGQYHRFEKVRRPERDRAERERQSTPAAGITAGSAFPVWLDGAVATLLDAAWRPGDLVAVGATGTVTRHRVRATFRCPVCADPTGPLAVPADSVADSAPPLAPPLARRPTTAAIPTRAGAPFGLDPDRMRDELGDPRFGPVVRMTRNSAGAFPMSEVELLAGTPAGIGRGSRFADAEVIGVLEAYERLGGYPHAAPIVVDATHAELGELAIDPAGLGGYTEAQLAAPTCRIRPYHPDAPLDWVWARPLLGGPPRLVPAEIGFYRYGYDLRTPGAGRRGCFLDSSSGSALGSSFEEAALHSLLELAERDAFLLAWHRARPLPAIDPATVTDPDSAMMLGLAADRGYQVHLLVATADIDIPVVWALAIRPDGQLPASLSAAGCHPDPEQAVRSALWELSQMVSAGLAWDPEPLRPSIADPWLVEDIPGHWRRYTFPELLPRVRTVLGGERRPLREAFDGWPDRLVRAAGGDVTGAVEYLADRYARAGLTEILAVDQSTPDHTALGLSVVKCVVPGILPMCFGQAHQRLSGLPRLYADGRLDPAAAPFDPHPFP